MIFTLILLAVAALGLLLMVFEFGRFVWGKVDDLLYSLRRDRLDPILFDDEV